MLMWLSLPGCLALFFLSLATITHLFRDLSLGHSKRDSTPPLIMPPKLAAVTAADDLPSSFGQLAASLSDSDFALTAYEIFLAACRTSSGKPLSFAANHSSTIASKVKKAFGLKSPGLASRKSPGSASGQGKPKRPLIVGELMRNQMKVSEAMDSHVRRVLLRISAGQGIPSVSKTLEDSD
ncbi:hypothetical protein AAZV13_15G148000 [Glycine max]|nr:uncharacterized protein LOC102665609 [Glycine max]|eukprot:XP_014623824.1 uncharacterized protein LOC102665609 [Glycine max]